VPIFILITTCNRVKNQESHCALISQRSGKFTQDTGFIGNINDDDLIKEIFVINSTFAPFSIKDEPGRLFLRLSKYVGSTADYEKVKAINYINGNIIIDFESSSAEMGGFTMNQPFILFNFSEACSNILTN